MFFEGPGKPNEGPSPPSKGRTSRFRGDGSSSLPISWEGSRRRGRRRAEVPRMPGSSPGPSSSRSGRVATGTVPGTSEGRARRGEAFPGKLAPGTDRSSPSGTAPLPAQASAARGRRGPAAAHLLPLLLLALGLFQGCLELHDVPPEEFPGHYWPPPPPPPAGCGGHDHLRTPTA